MTPPDPTLVSGYGYFGAEIIEDGAALAFAAIDGLIKERFAVSERMCLVEAEKIHFDHRDLTAEEVAELVVEEFGYDGVWFDGKLTAEAAE